MKKKDSRNQSIVATIMLHSANTLDAQYNIIAFYIVNRYASLHKYLKGKKKKKTLGTVKISVKMLWT